MELLGWLPLPELPKTGQLSCSVQESPLPLLLLFFPAGGRAGYSHCRSAPLPPRLAWLQWKSQKLHVTAWRQLPQTMLNAMVLFVYNTCLKPCTLWKCGAEKKEKKRAAQISVAGNLLLLLEKCYSTPNRNGLKSGTSSEGHSSMWCCLSFWHESLMLSSDCADFCDK